jgi:hypothetical protein
MGGLAWRTPFPRSRMPASIECEFNKCLLSGDGGLGRFNRSTASTHPPSRSSASCVKDGDARISALFPRSPQLPSVP